MQSSDSSSTQVPPLRFRPEPKKNQTLAFFAFFMLAFLIALAGMLAGFMYGDAYGRKHAQYDNPVLREYYAGQCYAYWETQFKKTVRQTLSKMGPHPEQTARLDEMRLLLIDMQQSLSDLALQKEAGQKKKVVSTSSSSLSGRLP